MSAESAQIEIAVIDSLTLLQSTIDEITRASTDIPSLFVDLEGTQLGRYGSISIMSLYVPTRKRIYLIDIYKLGTKAFSTFGSSGKSLKCILESSTILKVLFDVRHDSDALFSHYGISVDGIRDVQLMELGSRSGSKDFLAGLDRCVGKDSIISTSEKDAWRLIKHDVKRLYDPVLGGRYDIFNERPIRPIISKYCAGDVAVLPELYSTYTAKLHRDGGRFWELQVLEATKKRIELSQSPGFDGKSKSNARGPWSKEFIERAIDDWNEVIMDDALNFDDDYFDYDCCWEDDGPTSGKDIINDCDIDYYYSD